MATKKVTKKTKEVDETKKQTHHLILGPRITEKAALGMDTNRYTFNVSARATKNEIKKAIKLLYKVEPIKVNIAKISSERVFVRGKYGRKQGGVKAYVFLKKGDKIEIA